MEWKEYLLLKDNIKSIHQLNRYINFINSINNNFDKSCYYEIHHIIPQCLNSGITDTIKLTARQHFIAHHILSKCFSGNDMYKLNHAFVMMTNCKNKNRNYKITSRIYNECKLLNSENFKRNIINNPEIRAKIIKTMKQQYKDGLRKTSNGMIASNRNKVAVHNNVKTIYIEKDKVEGFLKENNEYQLGSRYSISKEDKLKHKKNLRKAWEKRKINNQGIKCMNNKIINKMVKPNEFDKYLDLGWTFGRIKIKRIEVS